MPVVKIPKGTHTASQPSWKIARHEVPLCVRTLASRDIASHPKYVERQCHPPLHPPRTPRPVRRCAPHLWGGRYITPGPFNATHYRRLMVSRFTPVEKVACPELCQVPYMPPCTAAVEDENYVPSGWIPGVLSAARLQVCRQTDTDTDAEETHRECDPRYPLLIFSPGYYTSRLLYSALAQAVSSAGYTVLTLDHAYEPGIVEFSDGSSIPGGRFNLTPDDIPGATWATDVRAADVTFLLDYMGIPKYPDLKGPDAVRAGVFGHSFGGATTAVAISKDLRIAGGINLDGSQFGRVVQDGFGSGAVPQAFVLWGTDGHDSNGLDTTWTQFWDMMHTPPHDEVWSREITVHPSTHNMYGDFGLLADAAGVRDQLSEEAKFKIAGPLAGARMMEIFSAYVGDFFAFVLKGEDEGLFSGPSEGFPEIRFIPY